MKTGYRVCGDHYACERFEEGTIFVLCDGIGSGIYANIAAITCQSRLMELLKRGISVRAAAETVASSMHRARTEDIPFSAFSALLVRPDGQFTIYAYEAPEAILIKNGTASVLKPRFYTYDFEVVRESTGMLDLGDSIILSSDGITQSGMGRGYGFGIGADGVASYINRICRSGAALEELPEKISEMCIGLSGGKCEDDMTLSLIFCRQANRLTVLTGPPSVPSTDHAYVNAFMSEPGKKVICGSTTADIVSRELGRQVRMVNMKRKNLGSPPEYVMDGVDLTTEGAIMLNQAYNILDEPAELFEEDTVVERFCIMLKEADAIHFMIGNAVNDAHEALLFKQVGVRVRRATIGLIADKLRGMGKLVTEKWY
jgi:hypothetical protein